MKMQDLSIYQLICLDIETLSLTFYLFSYYYRLYFITSSTLHQTKYYANLYPCRTLPMHFLPQIYNNKTHPLIIILKFIRFTVQSHQSTQKLHFSALTLPTLFQHTKYNHTHYFHRLRIINILRSSEMQSLQATQTAHSTIDLLLDKGASKLYDRYITAKLPQHVHLQNDTSFYNNLGLHTAPQPIRSDINKVPVSAVQQAKIDNHAPKHILVKKQRGELLVYPKNSNFGQSTKYQTIKTQRQSIGKYQIQQSVTETMDFQGQKHQMPTPVRKMRPLTLQTTRNHNNQNVIDPENKLEQAKEKRVMTSHNKKRKIFTLSTQRTPNFLKLNYQAPVYIREQIELVQRLRKQRKEKKKEQLDKLHQIEKIDTYIKMKEKKTKEHFQQMKKQLKGSIKQAPLTNFQTENAMIVINGKPKPKQKANILQLQFTTNKHQLVTKKQPQISQIQGKKKNSFITKVERKVRMTNQQFTNNGEPQISSIPFMKFNYGVVLTQSTVEATASRNRPNQLSSRSNFTVRQSQRFKSHQNLVSSPGGNIFTTREESTIQNLKSYYFQNQMSERKQLGTTLNSVKQLGESILWKARQKSEQKKIKISNLEAFNQQILGIKLVH